MRFDPDMSARRAGVSRPLLLLLAALAERPLDALLAEAKRGWLAPDGVAPTPEAASKVRAALAYTGRSGRDWRRCQRLYDRVSELWPDGEKSGRYRWRGNRNDVAARLQRFMCDYGDAAPDAVYDACRRYVDSFGGDVTYMRTLPNFVLRTEAEDCGDGRKYVTELSDLADWLDGGGGAAPC